MKLFLYLILNILFLSNLYSQAYKIQGIIIDKATKESVPFVNIVELNNNSNGTITDINGIFTFKYDSLNITLKFSHINYR